MHIHYYFWINLSWVPTVKCSQTDKNGFARDKMENKKGRQMES